MRKPRDEWPAEKESHLRKQWAKGISASIIAAELDTTRNAIIGKVRRLGLEQRETKIHFRSNGRREICHAGLPKPSKPRLAKPKLVFVKPPDPIEPGPEHRVSILGLKNSCCHYPVSHLTYCGAPVQKPFAYCEFHYRKTHQPGTALNDGRKARAA